ncbi:MAG TPA: dihydroorotate dehydrogenase electron transfer subunit [Bacillales bacterium]|nr:dihydroorotate dehydrogenase electron transfer subunit [Bacillales bacterium]
MKKAQVTVISQKEIARDIFEMRLHGDIAGEMTPPGRFVHLKADGCFETLLRRPISIADMDRDRREFTVIYRVDGKGTKNLSEKAAGDCIDLLGPLGNGFPTESVVPGQTALLVGGGIGVPPLYNLSKRLVEKGIRVKHVLGFSSGREVFYEKRFAELGETCVTTVDGSHGQKGFVTDAMKADGDDFHVMYACGPTPMLRALERQYAHKEAYFSLEQRMGCAVGACLACVCRVQGDETGAAYRKVCKDGPVFPLGEVVL